MIDIAILDPHPVVRAGLRQLISGHIDLRIVGEATTAHEAPTLLSAPVKPDVLLLDLPRVGQQGFDVMACVRTIAPDLGVLVFTAHPAEQYAIELLRQGALGYLNKNCAPNEIVDALRSCALRQRYLSGAVTELLANQPDCDRDQAPHEHLSERESQVFYKLAMGETSGRIAEALALSAKTVSTYRNRLLGKLNLTSNTDLTYYAINNRLIG